MKKTPLRLSRSSNYFETGTYEATKTISKRVLAYIQSNRFSLIDDIDLLEN